MTILTTSFTEIYPIWRTFLWPDRESKIESTSAMMFLSGYDLKNFNYTPTFFIYVIDDQIAGCNSGHMCADNSYRSRGLFVFPEHRKKGIGIELLKATIEQATVENASFVWSFPRETCWTTYKKSGFELVSNWEKSEVSLNAYCKKLIPNTLITHTPNKS